MPYLDGKTSSDGGNDAQSIAAASMVNSCLVGYTIRQGGTGSIPVPFVHDVGTIKFEISSPDLTVTPAVDKNGTISLNVSVRHAATMGPSTVNVTESSLGPGTDRKVSIFVSPITAASGANGGDDSNSGSSDSPFLTFQAAANAAEAGDTIYLRGLGPFGYPHEEDDPSSPVVTIKSGVTVASPTPATRSALHMPIVLAGDAVLDDLDIEYARLEITKPSSTIILQGGTIVGKGIEIAAAASTGPGAPPTTLHVYNAGQNVGEIRNDDPTLSSLSIAADRANVIIENGGAVRSDSSAAAIHSDGVGAVINFHGGTVVENSAGGPAIELAKVLSLDVDTVTFRGSVEILDPSSVATFNAAVFELAESTGEIVFDGLNLTVINSTFAGLAIVQNNPLGQVKLRNSQIMGYTQAGYRLIAGVLDAGTMNEPGNNTFADFFYSNNSHSLGTTQPSAFSVEVLDPPSDGVVATSSASMFNGMQPGTCSASQTDKLTMDMPGIVTITTPAYPIEVNFY